jgi:hypothetical protein
MPRRPTYLKKIQVDKLERKCCYCKTHRSARGFDKHKAWCKKTWIIRKELRDRRDIEGVHAIVNQLQAEETRSPSPTLPSRFIGFGANTELVEGSSSGHMEVEYPSPEMDSQEPTPAVNLDGTLTPSQIIPPDVT